MSRQRPVLERYFAALRSQDWASLAECLADDVRRTGPYRDVVEGKQAYVQFLSRVIPTLANYRLEVTRVRKIGDASAIAELTETLDVDGVSRNFPEALLFDFVDEGRILRIDIDVKRPPPSQAPRA